jgi:hypothetical protein
LRIRFELDAELSKSENNRLNYTYKYCI